MQGPSSPDGDFQSALRMFIVLRRRGQFLMDIVPLVDGFEQRGVFLKLGTGTQILTSVIPNLVRYTESEFCTNVDESNSFENV